MKIFSGAERIQHGNLTWNSRDNGCLRHRTLRLRPRPSMALSYNLYTTSYSTFIIFIYLLLKIASCLKFLFCLFVVSTNSSFISLWVVVRCRTLENIHYSCHVHFFCIKNSNLNYIFFVSFLHRLRSFFCWTFSYISSKLFLCCCCHFFLSLQVFNSKSWKMILWLSSLPKKMNMGMFEGGRIALELEVSR